MGATWSGVDCAPLDDFPTRPAATPGQRLPVTMFVDHDYPAVPVVTLLDPMPDDGTAVVIGDETGLGSLWVDWAHHGEIDTRQAVR